MRIVYIAGTPLPSRVASAVNIMKMCRALARAGHEVTLFARKGPGAGSSREVFATYGIEEAFELVLRAPPGLRGSKNLIYPLSVARELARRPRPDLLYGRHAYALALATGRAPGVPVAYEAHTFPLKQLRRAAERWLFRRPAFRSVVAISQALAEDYRAGFADFPGLNLLVAHDAADPVAPSFGPLPEPWPGRPDVRQIGYVGHLYPGKGMEVVASLAQRLPDLDFHVVGGTEKDIAVWRARVGTLANLHLHGFVPHARVPAWLARFDALLAPPTAEARSAAGRDIGRWMSPLKVFEYMAAGRPIIASDIPAIREILTDGETALLAPPQDIDAWVAALARLNDAELATSLGARARAVFHTRHTWDARAASVLAHLGLGTMAAPPAVAAA